MEIDQELTAFIVKGKKVKKNVPEDKWLRRLWIANGVAALFHFTFFVMVTTIGSQGKAPYIVYFDTFWADYVIPENLKTPFCCLKRSNHCSAASEPGYGERDASFPDCECKTYVEGEFREWMDCESRYSTEWKELNWDFERLYSPAIKNVFEVKTWVLLSVFEFLTFSMHLYLATYGYKKYAWYVRNKLQPYRWFEYSITSPIMLVAVASLSSITDVHLLLYMFLIQSYINLTGGWLYELCTFVQLRIERGCELGGASWKASMDGLARSSLVYTKWFFFFFAWTGFVLEFATIFNAFYTVLNPYFALESGDLWYEVFFFVEIATWGLFLSYFTFPAIHLYQVAVPYFLRKKKYTKWTRLVNENFYFIAEFAYIIASFFSKGFLTTVIFYAAIMRQDDNGDQT